MYPNSLENKTLLGLYRINQISVTLANGEYCLSKLLSSICNGAYWPDIWKVILEISPTPQKNCPIEIALLADFSDFFPKKRELFYQTNISKAGFAWKFWGSAPLLLKIWQHLFAVAQTGDEGTPLGYPLNMVYHRATYTLLIIFIFVSYWEYPLKMSYHMATFTYFYQRGLGNKTVLGAYILDQSNIYHLGELLLLVK